jgi:hypothetical protein
VRGSAVRAIDTKRLTALRLLPALGVSLLLHVLVLSRFGLFPYADRSAPARSLQVSLVAPAASPAAPAEPKAISIPELPLPAPAPRTPKINEKPRETPAPPVKPAAAVPAAPLPEIPPVAAGKEAATAEPAAGIPLPGLTGAVKRVEIEFEIYSGLDRTLIGTSRQLYVAESGDYYGLSTRSQINGDESAPGEPWQLDVSGRINRQGLSPSRFEVQGAMSERLMALKEIADPSALPAKARNIRMRDGILDRQSLLYQFMLQPPALTGGQLWLTDGSSYGLYTYRVAGFDSLPLTALGGVRAIKLMLSSSDSADTIELWLVPDMHYLPVKVRHTDRQGRVTEQLAISLDFKK